MSQHQHAEQAPVARSYEYADRTVVAADFGPGAAPTVDVVDGTLIVVVDDEQREFDVPAGDVETVNRNGVVTVEVRG